MLLHRRIRFGLLMALDGHPWTYQVCLHTMIIRSFDNENGFYVSVEEIEEHEKKTTL